MNEKKLRSIHFSQCFNCTLSECFLFLPQTHHLPSSSSPPCTVFVSDLASGWAGSSGKQNKAIWFLRPYAAPTPNNRPGETTLSRSHSQHYFLLIPALCLSLSEKLASHEPFKKHFSYLNLIVWFSLATLPLLQTHLPWNINLPVSYILT